MEPEPVQRRVKKPSTAPKNPPDHTIELTSTNYLSQRRSLRTTTQRNSEETKPDKLAENTTPSQEDSEKSPTKTHNTRLRNGIHKVKQKVSQLLYIVFRMLRLKVHLKNVSFFCFRACPHLIFNSTKIEIKYDNHKDESNGKQKEKMTLLDTCARELAEIDNASFQRSSFRDANKIFERLLLPMHFPWNHRAQRTDQVIRGMPCDIDDMFAFQADHGSDDDNEEDEVDRDGIMFCNRSSQDKGVIEIRNVRSSKRRRQPVTMGHPNSVPHVNEFAFRMYQEVQSRKLHQEENEAEAPRCLLSIQCNGVSSEASIFTDVPDGKTPLLLPAVQPRDVAIGKRMSVAKAKQLSHELGSYDCRYGLPDIPDEREQSGRRRRVFAGRTRTIWTRREDDEGKSTSPSARPTYASTITGEKLPVGSHKRPLPVKVGLKLNGRIVTVDKKITESCNDSLELAFKSGEDYQVSHAADVVNKAVEGSSKQSGDRASLKKTSSPKRSTQSRNCHRRKSR